MSVVIRLVPVCSYFRLCHALLHHMTMILSCLPVAHISMTVQCLFLFFIDQSQLFVVVCNDSDVSVLACMHFVIASIIVYPSFT